MRQQVLQLEKEATVFEDVHSHALPTMTLNNSRIATQVRVPNVITYSN